VAANYSSHDYTLGEAIETTVGNLTLLENSRHLSSIDAMFQIRAATVNLSTRVAVKGDLYVKDGSRLFVPIVSHDATGNIECRLAEKPALALSGCESCDAMEVAFEDVSLGFNRSVLRVFLSTSETHESEGYVNLVVVAALPIVAGPWRLPVLMVGKIGTNIVATTLSKLQYTTLGSFQIDMENGKFVLADSVLLLLRGSAAPKTVSRDGALAIENMNVIDAAGDDNDLLIRDRNLGEALATSLGRKNFVLMRGHGATIAAPSVEIAVFRSYYAESNAKLQLTAISLNSPISYLNEKEARNAMATNEGQIKRAWDFWCQQEEGLI
jgi:hypothetical protein